MSTDCSKNNFIILDRSLHHSYLNFCLHYGKKYLDRQNVEAQTRLQHLRALIRAISACHMVQKNNDMYTDCSKNNFIISDRSLHHFNISPFIFVCVSYILEIYCKSDALF